MLWAQNSELQDNLENTCLNFTQPGEDMGSMCNFDFISTELKRWSLSKPTTPQDNVLCTIHIIEKRWRKILLLVKGFTFIPGEVRDCPEQEVLVPPPSFVLREAPPGLRWFRQMVPVRRIVWYHLDLRSDLLVSCGCLDLRPVTKHLRGCL